MSMENAILEHASALRDVAAAVRALVDATMGSVVTGTAKASRLIDDKAAELAKTTDKRAAAAREAAAKDAQQNAAGATREHAAADNIAGEKARDADLEQAVSKVEDEAVSSGRKAINDALAAAKASGKSGNGESGAATTGASSETAGAGSSDDDGLDTPLDYAKDVRPVLLAAIKKAGRDKVQALISTFGEEKADKVDAAKFGELLAGAQKLAA